MLFVLLCSALPFFGLVAQPDQEAPAVRSNPLTLKAFTLFQNQSGDAKAQSAWGYGVGGQFNYSRFRRFDFNVRVEYDHMALDQDDVLDEWNWHYWDSTYSSYLLGEIFTVIIQNGDTIRNRDSMKYYINHVRHCESSSGEYVADFDPKQSMKELMVSVGFDYKQMISAKMMLYAGLNIGISKYFRRLEMHEHWIKRFELDSTQAGWDYDYKLNILHYAPQKKGTKLFAAPTLGWRYQFTDYFDLDISARYYHYFDETVQFIDQAFGISESSHTFFPYSSKYQVQLALVFRY